ncbi:MAG: hypothetical protein J6K62_04265 [Clostridia bacterium]|nr:hypothetical protein [Clostridia bacterium]
MKKFSLNNLLHKDRVMIIFSLVVAIAVWAIISFGPGNVQQRTITATVKIDLTDTSAEYDNLRVIGEDTFTVNVTVEGTRSIIYSLTSDDLEIKPDLSDIQGPGRSYVSLNVSKTGRYTDYTINSISPATVTVECEKWTNDFYPVEFADSDKAALNVSVADDSTQFLPKNAITLDTAVVRGGRVQIEGPQTVTSQIHSVRVVLDGEHVLSKTSVLRARLVAYNESDQPIDLSGCTIVGSSDGMVAMTVPVRATKTVDLTFKLINVPTGLKTDGLVTLLNPVDKTPLTQLTLVGDSDVLATIGDTIDLGTIDFDFIQPSNAEFTRMLILPEGVEPMSGSSEVLISVAVNKYRTKKLSYTVDSVEDLVITGLPEGRVATLYGGQAQILTDIVLCGDSRMLSRIKAEDLVLTVDLSAASGYTEPEVRITVPGYPSVWVYYGEESEVSKQYPHQLSIDVVDAKAAATE